MIFSQNANKLHHWKKHSLALAFFHCARRYAEKKNRMRTWIDARDKPALLLAVMKELAGRSSISFEGDLSNLLLNKMDEAKTEETAVLARQTVSPVLDFLILPLTDKTINEIWHELSGKDHLVNEGIVHVQIESEGELAFGGYDNFHSECTIAYRALSIEFLESLKNLGVIRDLKHESA